MQTTNNTTDLHQWFTLNGFTKSHSNFNRSQIEWLHRNRESNGFAKAFRKIGKQRYLHAGIFADCLRNRDE